MLFYLRLLHWGGLLNGDRGFLMLDGGCFLVGHFGYCLCFLLSHFGHGGFDVFSCGGFLVLHGCGGFFMLDGCGLLLVDGGGLFVVNFLDLVVGGRLLELSWWLFIVSGFFDLLHMVDWLRLGLRHLLVVLNFNFL